MPNINLFPRALRLVHFVFDHLRDPGLSDHHGRGSGPALDARLYEQPTFPVIERPDAGQLGRSATMPYIDPTHGNRWDSEGRYFEG